MRFLTGILFLWCVCSAGKAFCVVKDSLLQILPQEKSASERCILLRNLADLSYDTPDGIKYLKLLIQEASQAGFGKILPEAMGDLAIAHMTHNDFDSAAYCLESLNAMEKTEDVQSWITYLNMCRFNLAMSDEDRAKAIDEVRNKLVNRPNEDIYSRIENAYIVGCGLCDQDKFEQALTYAITAEKLAVSLPFKSGCRVHMYTIRLMARILIRERQFLEGIGWTEKYIELLEKCYEQYYRVSRPYYYINSLRIAAYSTLMINVLALPAEKADYYFRKVVGYNAEATSLYDKYSCNHIMYNYYVAKEEYTKALAINDSLMSYAKIIAPYNLPSLYRISSVIHEFMGDYKESLTALKIYHSMQDSLNTVKANEHLNQLQVEYDVNKLNYENSQLEIKNKQIILICLACVLLLLTGICVYLYRTLKKERMMKIRLCELNAKAEECEKMKTLFIRSVCHEIRTPLNAIVGFSDLLCMSDIDEEMRQSFPPEIQKNSLLLTSLISRMLEVAELDVSNERLPVEPTDIHVVCVQSMELLQDKGRQEISYVLDIPEQPLTIQTHSHYLMLVLENLLDNASKFTESGRIILHYEADQVKHKLLISITDSGCGIPVEMHGKVFERFSKLDAYKPGNGLGLYLCRLIIERLEGRIYIDPEYTQGTRVWVELPML